MRLKKSLSVNQSSKLSIKLACISHDLYLHTSAVFSDHTKAIVTYTFVTSNGVGAFEVVTTRSFPFGALIDV